jgi:hypothetical protein
MQPTHIYEVRPRKDHPGVDLISDALPFGARWYGGWRWRYHRKEKRRELPPAAR